MFKQYQSRIDSEIQKAIVGLGEKTALRDACEYALVSGGKRLRPLFVLMISDALGLGYDVMPAALSVEYFHTASLIADDLPCLDTDDERRGRASLHKKFDESVALLASYTFIASGYEGIYKNGRLMKNVDPAKADQATILSLEIATRCAGIKGATNGQFLDLFPPDKSLATMRKIMEQKTVTLFQISFALGWLFGGGDESKLKEVEKTAYHLGMAFQIGDDLQDEIQDGGEVNMATLLGAQAAHDLFEQEMEQFVMGLKNLGLWNRDFEMAADYLYRLAPAVVK